VTPHVVLRVVGALLAGLMSCPLTPLLLGWQEWPALAASFLGASFGMAVFRTRPAVKIAAALATCLAFILIRELANPRAVVLTRESLPIGFLAGVATSGAMILIAELIATRYARVARAYSRFADALPQCGGILRSWVRRQRSNIPHPNRWPKIGLQFIALLLALTPAPLAWVAHSFFWINERHAARFFSQDMPGDPNSPRAPGGLWVFGERGHASVVPWNVMDIERYRALFPEADVGKIRFDPQPAPPIIFYNAGGPSSQPRTAIFADR
jgi:hypothetical protein